MEQSSDPGESYDYNSSIGNMIKQIILMLKHPNIDSNLSKILDDFLKELNESNKYLASGIFKTNFIEAALLLQNAVTLYGKKVDLLWECVIEHHKRMISYEKEENKENEVKKLEERQHKFRRKKTLVPVNEAPKNNLLNNFAFGANDVQNHLHQNYEPHNLLNEWNKFDEETTVAETSTTTTTLFTEKHNVIFQPNNAIYDMDDEEYIGRYDQIQSTTLTEELFRLDKFDLIEDLHGCICNMRIESYVISDFLYEHKITSDQNKEKYIKNLNEYITNFRHGIKNQRISFCRESYVNLERLPNELIINKLKRMSFTDSLINEELPSTLSESDTGSFINNELNENANTTPKRNVSCSKDSAFYDCDDDMDDRQSIIHCTPTSSLFTLEILGVNTSTPSSRREVITENLCCDLNGPECGSSQPETVTNNQLCCGSSTVISKLLRTRVEKVKDEKIKTNNKVVKNKKISIRELRKLAKGITANFREFERFYCVQYKPADGEGESQMDFSECEPDEAAQDEAEDFPSENEDNETNNNNKIVCTSADHLSEIIQNITEPSSLPITAETSLVSNNCTREVITTQCSEEADSGIGNSLSLNEENISHENMTNWKSFILPKIKKLNNKSDFNIHDYESKIMNSMEVGETKYFNDIVSNSESSSDVVKYFIASLQLANTNNIEIIGTNPGHIANETLQVKVLDKTKHFELLEEYQAPSVETFRERLSNVKRINYELSDTSTSSPPLRKKLKVFNWKRKE